MRWCINEDCLMVGNMSNKKSFLAKIEEGILRFTKPDYMDSKEKIDDFLENRLDDKLFEFIFKSIDINGTKVFAFGDEKSEKKKNAQSI